jgi:hypothetical protein
VIRRDGSRVDVSALIRDAEKREADGREEQALQYLFGLGASVLGGMITRYDFELFADVETEDFYDLRHKALWMVLRDLEAQDKHVDGEFLLADIAAHVEREDRERGRQWRQWLTDDFVRGTLSKQVIPATDRASIALAIATLKASAICRCEHSSAVEVLDCISRLRRRD